MQVLMKLVQIVDKLMLVKKCKVEDGVLEELLKVLISRKVSIDVVYQYWLRQKD